MNNKQIRLVIYAKLDEPVNKTKYPDEGGYYLKISFCKNKNLRC